MAWAMKKLDGKVANNFNIGFGILMAGDDPLIGSISPKQLVSAGGSANIWAEGVTNTGTIETVWSVISSPGYQTEGTSKSLTDLPVVESVSTDNGRFEGTYSDFTIYGTCQIRKRGMVREIIRCVSFTSQIRLIPNPTSNTASVNLGLIRFAQFNTRTMVSSLQDISGVLRKHGLDVNVMRNIFCMSTSFGNSYTMGLTKLSP